MTRVLLLSSNTVGHPYPVYPLGMAVVAGALAAQGHTVRQFDMLAANGREDALSATIRAFAPEVVGVSLRNLDDCDALAVSPTLFVEKDGKLIETIRRATTAPIVLGGPAFSLCPEELLAYLGADYGVVGEGEEQICRLVDALADARSVPRLLGGDGALLDGRRMAPPLFDPDLVAFYRERAGMFNVQSKRGCSFRCVYCAYPQLEGRRFRPREVRQVADEVERAKACHGLDTLFFTDSVFNDPEEHYLMLAEELIRRGTPVRWCGCFRPQGITRRVLALLKRSGLYAMELGTDAVTDATLHGLGKDFTVSDVLAVHQACLREETPCAHFVMFGGPGETEATLAEGLATIARLDRAVVFAYAGIRILPGTELRRRAIAEGVILQETSLLRPAHYFAPTLDRGVAHRMLLRAFRGRHDRVFPPTEGRLRLSVLHRFGQRGILWDRLLRRPPRSTGHPAWAWTPEA